MTNLDDIRSKVYEMNQGFVRSGRVLLVNFQLK